MRERVLLIGPYPPPDHGTSIPFKYLVDFVQQNCDNEVFVVNTESGDKSTVRLYSPKAVRYFLLISWHILRKSRFCDIFIISGSQRFVATVGALYTVVLSTLLRKQICIYIHGGAFDVYYTSMNPLFKFIVRQCLNRAKIIAVQTKLVYTSLSRDFRNLVVVPNWTNVLEVSELDGANTMSDHRAIRFVYIGEVRREKGIIELIKAYQKARHKLESSNVSVTMDIFGPTRSDFRDVFYNLLSTQDNSVTYHGYLDHATLLKQLRSFDVLCLPTYFPSEGYPGVILEAMSFGLPVIATRWRAIPEIVIHEENGLLCEPRDVEGLANCMIRIALDDQLRRRLGERAREVAKQFDVNVVLPRLCTLCGLKIRIPAQ